MTSNNTENLTPRRAAILFGINYTKCSSNQLRGCHNDVDLMEKYLIEVRGYAKESITKCIDRDTPEDLYRTSTQGMVESVRELIERSHKEDLDEVFFTYSGHGSQVRDYTGKEEDGMNEIILPWNFQTGGYISDDVIHNALCKMNPKTRVICIFDCCHSGSMADIEFKYMFDRQRDEIEHKQVKQNAGVPGNVITLSGCKDSQVSMDAYNVQGRRQFSGAMTACLTRVLREMKHENEGKEVKLFDLFKRLHDALGHKDFVQMPVLFSSKVLSPEDTF